MIHFNNIQPNEADFEDPEHFYNRKLPALILKQAKNLQDSENF